MIFTSKTAPIKLEVFSLAKQFIDLKTIWRSHPITRKHTYDWSKFQGGIKVVSSQKYFASSFTEYVRVQLKTFTEAENLRKPFVIKSSNISTTTSF